MKYARKQVTDHGHATLEGVRGIRTDVPIRSSVRSPFPPFRIKSKQKVLRLNADYLDGYHASTLPVRAHHATHETGGSDALAAIDASIVTTGILAQQRGGLGKALNLTGLADQYYLYYDAGSDTFKVAALPAGAAHNLLSATHGDTLADSVVAGDLIYGNATPKWARLPKSSDSYVLTIDPTTHLPTWKALPAGSPHDLLDGSTDQDTLAGTVILGDVIAGNSTPKWQRVAGQTTTTRKFLRQTGTGTVSALPAWDTVIDADVVFSNVTTGDVSISQHGYAPKAPNDATKFLNGVGAYAVPAGSGVTSLSTLTGALNAFVEIARATLASPATSLALTSIPAYTNLLVLIWCPSFSAGDAIKVRFNNDSGNNYALSYNHNGGNGRAASLAFIAQLDFGNGAATTGPTWAIMFVHNETTLEKNATVQGGTGNTGAANAPYAGITIGKWANTSVQINEIDLVTVNGKNMGTGTYIIVYGAT
jgi:hypothetical protein